MTSSPIHLGVHTTNSVSIPLDGCIHATDHIGVHAAYRVVMTTHDTVHTTDSGMVYGKRLIGIGDTHFNLPNALSSSVAFF